MRSTRASSAIDRLNRRSDKNYSMIFSSNGLFCLVLKDETGETKRLSELMPMDDFVVFVNAYGPQTLKRVSKLDIEFSKQLNKNK
ncbi:MAG: hypothetical protein H0W85_04640 [Methylotenera sp.]|nr:hypothetical protein [Methylotenera sp.]